MKRSGRIRGKLVVGLIAFALVAVVAWTVALPVVARSRVTAFTGCPVEAETIRLNPFTGTVRVVDFHLRNPAGFPQPEFVDLPLLDVDVDVFSLLGDELRVRRAVINLAKITIVTTKEGVTNYGVVHQRVDAVKGPASAPDDTGATQKFRISELVIRLGALEMIDYSRGSEPVRRTLPLNAEHRFNDVTDPKVVAGPLLADLARANVPGLLSTFGGFLPEPFRGAFDGSLDGAGKAVKKLIDSLPVGR